MMNAFRASAHFDSLPSLEPTGSASSEQINSDYDAVQLHKLAQGKDAYGSEPVTIQCQNGNSNG